MKKVGLLVIATNKYTRFLQPLISSADEFFLKDCEVTYFIFTNKDIDIQSSRNIVKIDVNHKEWPWMTLGRYKIFSESSDKLSEMDYLYYCDADMRFVGDVGDEILSERVATQHPGYYDRRGTPETNPLSLACVFEHEEMQYFAGGFNGGTSNEYLKMAKHISNNIDIDYSKDLIAIWHDESHLNRYMIDNKPTKILDPSYCCIEWWVDCPFGRRLLALDKNHSEIRSEE
jgi:histo-blood group ABO system transferase